MKSSFRPVPWCRCRIRIPDEIGAQMLINTITALTVIRAAYDALPPDARTGVVTLLTGAGSAVGCLTGKVLAERGVKVIRLVRSEASAAKLASVLPGSPAFAKELAAWKDRVRAAAEGARSTSRSTASAGVCWATSRICWLKGPGPSSISAHSAGRRATSVYFRPGPSRSKAWCSAVGCSSHRSSAKPILRSHSGSRRRAELCSRLPTGTCHLGSPPPSRMPVKQVGQASFSSISRKIRGPDHEVRNDRRRCGRACVRAGGPGEGSRSGLEQPAWSRISCQQGC